MEVEMRVLFLVLVSGGIVCGVVAGVPKKDDGQAAEFKKLQGLWQTVPGGIEQQDGEQIVRQPTLDGPCFFIRGDRLIWLDEEGAPNGKEATITLDIKASPKLITLTPVDGKKEEKPVRGIYEVEGSNLHVNIGLDGGAPPKQFLELNKPIKGVDGREMLIGRKKLQSK
jgi:uncharacterized protein (TIGR03067 family)